MHIGLQVGFGDLIGAGLLAELKGFGLDMVRISANRPQPPFAASPTPLPQLIQEVLDADLRPLMIIRDAGQIEQI